MEGATDEKYFQAVLRSRPPRHAGGSFPFRRRRRRGIARQGEAASRGVGEAEVSVDVATCGRLVHTTGRDRCSRPRTPYGTDLCSEANISFPSPLTGFGRSSARETLRRAVAASGLHVAPWRPLCTRRKPERCPRRFLRRVDRKRSRLCV